MEETTNTLNYAHMAKRIKNKPQRHLDAEQEPPPPPPELVNAECPNLSYWALLSSFERTS